MKFEIVPTLVYLCLLSLLIGLGNWQLGRSEQKRQFLARQEQGLASWEVMPFSADTEDNVENIRYKKVRITGHYDQAHQFLIDNQISAGKAGYYVLTPLILQGEAKAVLVNRGWIPLNQDRTVLPDLQISQELTTVTGRINSFPTVGIKLAGAEIPTDSWPSVIQVVDSQVLAKKLTYTLFSFQLELDKELPAGFKREWKTATIMLPEQHTAYAVQWFSLAFTLTLLFIWYSFKSNDE
jgi:surfeit locus 1 family protein